MLIFQTDGQYSQIPALQQHCKDDAYEVFSSWKEDSETAIIYCDNSSINSYGDYALMNLLPKLMAYDFLDVHYLNVYRGLKKAGY